MAVSLPRPTQSLKIIKVFLASPGDLQLERREAHAAIEEVNRTVARPAGYHVDLVAWEETLSERNRPQAVINRQLRLCQVFVGMMWKKWGTPPDKEGNFTSGFEEEYTLACELNDNSGSPSISLYFKDIDENLLSDPGDELKKVLNFKAGIIEEKEILFETFSNEHEFAQKMRLAVSEYINSLREADSEDDRQRKDQPKEELEEQGDGGEETISPTNTNPEASFLALLSSKLAGTESEAVAAVDIARLRNLAAGFRQEQNDELYLQAHDANILFGGRKTIELGAREKSLLADAGLINFRSENVPLWTWLKDRLENDESWLEISTWVSKGSLSVGAIDAMRTLGEQVRGIDGSRSETLDVWFGDDRSAEERKQALRYLQDFGSTDDHLYINKEIERNDSETSDHAVAAMTKFLLRNEGRRAAADFAISQSFGSLPASLIKDIVRGIEELDDSKVLSGLDHRSSEIRLVSFEVALSKQLLTKEDVLQRFDDSDAQIRLTALEYYEETFGKVEKDTRNVLVVNKPRNALFGGPSNYDHDGERAFKSYKLKSALARPLSDLRSEAEDITFDELAYFAFRRRKLKEHIEQLRLDFDDGFKQVFADDLVKQEVKFEGVAAAASLFERVRKNEGFSRRGWMRLAADILEDQAEPTDLARIRSALDDDALDPKPSDIVYLAKVGDAEDVARIAKIHDDYRVGGLGRSLLSFSPKPTRLAAEAVLRLSKSNFDLILQNTGGDLLAAVLYLMPLARVKDLSPEKIHVVLNDTNERVRKVATLKILSAWKSTRIRDFFETYEQGPYRYYNVIFWLDLINFANIAKVRAIARRTLEDECLGWTMSD